MSSLRDGLITYWPLEINSKDKVGGNSGSDTSITYDGEWAIFNGSSSKIFFSQNLGSYNDISFFTWIKTSQTSQGKIIQLSNSTTSFELDVNASAGKLSLTFYDGTTYRATTTNSFNDGLEHFVVCVRKGSTLYIYVDNALEATASTATTTLTINSANSVLGTHFSVAVYYNGKTKRFGIKNYVLSIQEQTNLFNNGRGLSYPFIKPNIFKRISKYIGSATSSFNPAIARRRLLLRK